MTDQQRWKQLKEWDKKYYMHNRTLEADYVPFALERTESTDTLVGDDGRRYLDFMNQAVCANSGQSNEYIRNRIRECIDRYGVVVDLYLTEYKAMACKLLMEDILGPDNWAGRIKILSDGSDAVEVAAMMARIFTQKPVIATREYSFHGWTGTAVSLTQVRSARNNFWDPAKDIQISNFQQSHSAPVVVGPSPFCFRCSLGHKKEECISRGVEYPCVSALRHRIEGAGTDCVAALITEPIQGVGSVIPPEGYIRQIRAMTKELGILWIADEILTGFGRTGKWFAYQYYGAAPDILVLGKGLANSASCSAVVVSKELASFFETKWWKCVSTYAANPLAMAALVGNLEFMIERNIPLNAIGIEAKMGSRLKQMKEKYKCVGNVDGCGALWSLELVKDDKNTPFIQADRNWAPGDRAPKSPVYTVREKALEKGAIFGGFMPNTIRIATSLVISDGDINKGLDALEYGLSYLDSTL